MGGRGVVATAGGRVLAVVLEGDVDVLEALERLGLHEVGVGELVGDRQVDRVGERGKQGARVEPAREDDVELETEDEAHRRDVEPDEQTEDDAEDPLGRAGPRDRPRDE